MKEFVSILLSFLFMSFAENIDMAFNNMISIDAIVVAGSFLIIDSIFKAIGEIGSYTYRTVRKDEWKYLCFNILFSLIIGILVFIFKPFIINFFDLTIDQKQMLSILLNIYIAYIVIGRFANAVFEITRLKNHLKLYRHALFVYYFTIIIFDVLVYIFTKDLTLLFVATITSWILSTIYMLYNLKLKFTLPDKEAVKNVLKYGFAYSIEQLFSGVFLLLYGVLASHMGTDKYSIHTVCYTVCLSLEIITSAYQAALMIKVPDSKTKLEKYNKLKYMKRNCFSIVIILNFILSLVYLVISHGSLPIEKCFPYIFIYATAVFGLYEYETYKTLCVIEGKSYILLIGTFIGVITRFLICLIFINSKYVLYIFGFVNFIDYYVRSIIYRIIILNKKNNLH